MRLIRTVLCAALALSSLTHAQTASLAERSRALDKLFDDYWQDSLLHSPESATELGDKRYNDRWSDYTAAAANSLFAREAGFITRLGAIDTTGLTEQQRLSSELLLRQLIEDQESARFKEWQTPINQFNGPHTGMPQVIAMHPTDTVKDFDDYITRLNKVPAVFAQLQESMTLGADEHRTPPAVLMQQVVQQVNAIASAKPEDSPFAAPLKKLPKTFSAAEQKRIRTEALQAISDKVAPAYNRFARFLTAQYIPKARTQPGISALPDGPAYYQFLIRRSTTLPMTAVQIHQLGLAEVKRDEGEMLAIAKRLGFNDLKSFNASIKTNPKLHATSAQQLVDVYKAPLAAMQARLPQLFGRLPKAPVEVVTVPAYMEQQQSQAYYDPGTPDGKRPGRVSINTYKFADRGLEGVESIAYHEGIPGHHLQISIAQELEGLPEFRKQEYFTAYTEGWGLYAERLGKDVGFYTDPYSDYGRLESDIWRAIRLVVDTGVHSKGWTRQQMVDFFHDHSAIDETNVQAETDRYIAWPAQALGYKLGQLKFLEMRQRAQTKLGSSFDIRHFHDLILDSGALPMDILDRRVDAWIAGGGK